MDHPFFVFLRNPVSVGAAVVALAVIGFGVFFLATNYRLFLLGIKNLRRHIVRTSLTALATMVLVLMITMIWTIVYFIDLATTEKAKDFKLIITERWQIPSQLPMTHGDYLNPRSSSYLEKLRGPDGNPLYRPTDFMTWSFYGGTMDPAKRSIENLVFFFAMDPDAIIPMMDDLENLDPTLVEKLKSTPNGCLLGSEKLAQINKRVGERFKLTSINYKDIDLDFEVVGVLPDGRYNSSAVMNISYFNNAFERYRREKGVAHPLDMKRLNLIWLRVPDRETFDKVGGLIETAPQFGDRPVKVESASSGISSFLDAYKDLLWGMKYLLVPAILVIMTLVTANAISITVRERRTEMAVMKVLGFRPNQILQLILGEALFVGTLSGLVAAAGAFLFFNLRFGGIPFRIAFFPVFRIPEEAILWGLAMGAGTAFAGSILPAWTAREVKVSEVFSKVT